ncbi:MAG: bifunctional 5,10-methylenetetrahydrofolate dehydrogenase/5,10-methenyltetrahydrofolate cyclohydrolase [Candidatus Spechtbacterales bacterium]
MSAKTLDGRELSQKILEGLKEETAKLNKKIKLGVVIVGTDPATERFVERKKKMAKEIGIDTEIYKYNTDITTKDLRENIKKICGTPGMGGVIVQLPLPEHINSQNILGAIPPGKDIDVLGYRALGKFYAGKSPISPPTATGILKLLTENGIEIKGKIAVMVGYGKLVGRPTAFLLEELGATVIAINSDTKNKAELVLQADIVVSGTGVPGSVTKDMVKNGAVVVDAGISISHKPSASASLGRDESAMSPKPVIVGDVADDVKEVAGYITPVPGGVGPMTVAMILYNLVELAKYDSQK